MTSSIEPVKLSTIVVPMFAADRVRKQVLRDGASTEELLGVASQDDCAAFAVSGDQILVFGSDYVRGPKFSLYELGYLSNYDLGWYLAGANLSDVAAMGAQPIGLLSVIRYPRDMDDADFTDVLRGVRDACRSVGAANVGGDIGTAERLILSASAFGTVERRGLLRRSSARPGQTVVITGRTGLAGAALRYLTEVQEGQLTIDEMDELLINWRRVAPRVAHGRILSGMIGRPACMDTSDGLAGTLQQICKSSEVGMEIDANAVPIAPLVAKVADQLNVDVQDLVFGDSVDFELVGTVETTELDRLHDQARSEGLEFFAIGSVTTGESPTLVRGGARSSLPGTPWTNSA